MDRGMDGRGFGLLEIGNAFVWSKQEACIHFFFTFGSIHAIFVMFQCFPWLLQNNMHEFTHVDNGTKEES